MILKKNILCVDEVEKNAQYPRHTTRVECFYNYGVSIVNKTDMVNRIADATNLTKADAGRAVDAFVDAVKHTLEKGDEVRLVGFGTFCVAHRKPTEGRNPRTGEKIKIPAKKVPKFKPGKELTDAVSR